MSNSNENPLETPASNLTGESVTDSAQRSVVAATNLNFILPGNDADVNAPGKDEMTMKNNYRHGFYAFGVSSERILCDTDEMLRLTWKNQGILVGREAYMSAFTYPDEFAGFVNENIRKNGTSKGCTKGYDGPCGADYLLIDIDREGNLQAAFDDTVKLVQHLGRLGLASESVMVAFSGGKGTHLYVPTPVFGEAASPSITFNAECRKVAETLAGAAGITIDSMIYDKNRLFRAPNSLHPKTGLYKIFVTVDELAVPNAVESVSTRATSPRLLTDIPQENCPDADAVCYTPPSEAPLADFWRSAVTEVKAVRGVTLENATISPVAEKYRNLQTDYARNRIIKFLEASQPAIQGREGDKTLFTLACRLVDGFALDVPVATEYIMAHWNHKAVPPWDEKDVRYKCESAQKYVEPDRPRGYLWEEGNARYGVDTSPGVCAQNNAWQDTNLRDPATFQDFPLECLPEPVNRYVREKARALNQNPSGLAYALLVLAGACVGAKVKLKLSNDREVASILWYALIGISGSGKTPLINSCVRLVHDVEFLWHKRYVEEMRVYERENAEYERSLKSKTVRARAGNEECVRVSPPVHPKQRKATITGTATIEGIYKDLEGNPSGLLLVYDELAAWFSDMERGSRTGASSMWLSGYNGLKATSSRSSAKEVNIEAAWWSIIGGSTPERLRSIFQSEHRMSDGTLSRFDFIWPPELDDVSEEDVSEGAIAEMKKILENLLMVTTPQDKPFIVTLDDEAKILWKAWRKEIFHAKRLKNNDLEKSFISKSEERLPRILLILYLLEAAIKKPESSLAAGIHSPTVANILASPVITAEMFLRAKAIVLWLINETYECYLLFRFINPPSLGEEVLQILKREGKPMTSRDIGQRRRKFANKGKDRLEETLSKLVEQGCILCKEVRAKNHVLTREYSLPVR